MADDDDVEERSSRDFVVRRTTKIEFGLAVGLVAATVTIVSFVSSVRGQVEASIDAITELKTEFQVFRAQATDMAVLKYRVEQLEKGRR